ncbi:MAG: glycosyltransferase [Planctomycetales bacterium]|nr:glycosyltransferase [Planctomycetales bacterium]
MNKIPATRHTKRTSPLRVQFLVTSLPVGGAEMLLLNLVRGIDRNVLAPEVVCLKGTGELGASFQNDVPLHANLLRSKWDVRVFPRLTRLFRGSATDAVITVGAGDKMFWGRLAARWARVPVICSALHSTGWPDGVGKLNRMLTPITDGFIACAQGHADYLAEVEGFPAERVFMIPNGVDTDRFHPNPQMRIELREELGIAQDCPIVGIVAALRPEKNHAQLVAAAREVLRRQPHVHFVVVGEGPERARIEQLAQEAGIGSSFHLLGNRHDTERLLAGFDLFCLTSKNEANPVSVLESLACGVPAVCPKVGSIHESVQHERTGLLTQPLDAGDTAHALLRLLADPGLAADMGQRGRSLVCKQASLHSMVAGYQQLITRLYNQKAVVVHRPQFVPEHNKDPSFDCTPKDSTPNSSTSNRELQPLITSTPQISSLAVSSSDLTHSGK